jgi:hypothetical protein
VALPVGLAAAAVEARRIAFDPGAAILEQ